MCKPTTAIRRRLSRRISCSLTIIVGIGAGFIPPHPARAADQEIPGYVVLPLSLMEEVNQATIRVSLNGKDTRLILDTGASSTLLDRRFYQGARTTAANVKPRDLPQAAQPKVDANGQAAEVGHIDSLKAGAVEFGQSRVVVTDLSAAFARYNAKHSSEAIAGLLGEEFLREHAAIIDWSRRGIYLNTVPTRRIKLGPGLAAAGWTAVPMATTNARHFTVPATVEGKTVKLIVDTGAQFTTFTPDVVKLTMLFNRDNGGSIGHLASNAMTMGMIGGNATMYPARVEHWKVGGFEIASSVVAVQRFPNGMLTQKSAGDGPILGLLGCEVLAKNKAIIDIAGSTLYLKSK